MAKPRTNYDAVQYWADSILEREPRASLDVNSIVIARDTVYSFGYHYPMGRIIRDEKGRARRVVLNSDYYPSRGFASTPTDQGNTESAARNAVAKLRHKCRLEFKPLSGYKLTNGVACRPKPGDPEMTWPWMEVPRVFHASDPGPEPVKDPEGCIAGTYEEYGYQAEDMILLSDDARPWEWTVWHRYSSGERTTKYPYVRRMHNGFIYWGLNHSRGPWGVREDEDWTRFQSEHPGADIDFKQCPHCLAFERVLGDWGSKYHGGWARRWRHGWKLYSEMIDTYGSVEGWRDAYRADWRRVVSTRKAIKAWIERNHMPLSAVDTDEHRIPILDADGYPLRKNSERYFREVRERDRQTRRHQREAEEQARIRRHAHRLYERRQSRVQRRRELSFEGTADRVARELRDLRMSLSGALDNPTTERES